MLFLEISIDNLVIFMKYIFKKPFNYASRKESLYVAFYLNQSPFLSFHLFDKKKDFKHVEQEEKRSRSFYFILLCFQAIFK